MSVKAYIKTTKVLVPLLLLALFAAGCKNVIDALKVTREEAKQVQSDVQAAVVSLEEQIKALPEGDPVRKALEEKLAKAVQIGEEVGRKLDESKLVLDAIETGNVSPELIAALSVVPYGQYVAIALPLLLALAAQVKAGKYKDALARVVKSWQEVGEELKADEKKEVALIQGPAVTALVHKIKSDQANA